MPDSVPALDRPLSPPSSGPLSWLTGLYRPEAPLAPIQDAEARRRAYFVWRWRMFAGFFLGYAVLYFCRKNISNALSPMGADLGLTNTQLGAVGTTLYVTYGLGKFANGVMADRSNIRRFMASGLIISGLLNLVFASTVSVWLLALVWGLNGWFQSMGFPPIARGMTLWYPPEGKATRWAFWTCSHQAGTAAVMALTAWVLTWGTWRTAFWLPGLMTVAMGAALLFLLGDTPESRGLESAKAFEDPKGQEEAGDFKSLFIRRVLLNRNVWVVGLIDLCVYVVRYGTLDWASKFLRDFKHYPAELAGYRASLMPLAGIAGVLLSGFAADALFKSRYRAVNAFSLAALALSIYGLFAIGPDHPYLDIALLVSIGFFVEGPQSILGGVGAVDAGGSARVASSAAGLIGVLAYFGASISGVGTGWLVDREGWGAALAFWIACALIGFALCLFAWKEPKTPSSAH